MQQTLLFFLVIVTLAAVVTVEGQLEDRFRLVKEINPIASLDFSRRLPLTKEACLLGSEFGNEYWAQNRLRRKLPLMDALAAKNKQEGGDSVKYRNCFFSPVQCQLPVTVEKDSLVTALNIPNQAAFDRFRRLGWGRK